MKKIYHNKKGIISFNMINTVLRLVFLTVVFFVVVLMLNVAISMNSESERLEADVFIHRLLYSPSGVFMFDQVTGRVVTSIVDSSQLTTERIESDIYFKASSHIGAKIELYKFSKLEEGAEFISVKNVYFQKSNYDSYKPIYDAWGKIPGIGGMTQYTQSIPVVIDEDGVRTLGRIEFEVLIPK